MSNYNRVMICRNLIVKTGMQSVVTFINDIGSKSFIKNQNCKFGR